MVGAKIEQSCNYIVEKKFLITKRKISGNDCQAPNNNSRERGNIFPIAPFSLTPKVFGKKRKKPQKGTIFSKTGKFLEKNFKRGFRGNFIKLWGV
ncbi:MAG: hypothetical protein CM15mP58_00530 [Burkholderiaceae bacterium]|nr:MAG: hypothetical protein CM15mP58_00530 [Burkholderiaceae bacterium]